MLVLCFILCLPVLLLFPPLRRRLLQNPAADFVNAHRKSSMDDAVCAASGVLVRSSSTLSLSSSVYTASGILVRSSSTRSLSSTDLCKTASEPCAQGGAGAGKCVAPQSFRAP